MEREGGLCCGCRGRIGERGRCLKQTARLRARGCSAAEAPKPREPGFGLPEPLSPAVNCSKPEHGGFSGSDETPSYQAEEEDRISALTVFCLPPGSMCQWTCSSITTWQLAVPLGTVFSSWYYVVHGDCEVLRAVPVSGCGFIPTKGIISPGIPKL